MIFILTSSRLNRTRKKSDVEDDGVEKWPLNLNKIKRPLSLAYFLQASIVVTGKNKDKRRLLETDWPYFKGYRSLPGILNQRTWYSLTNSALHCSGDADSVSVGSSPASWCHIFFFIVITEMEECRAPYITGGHVWGPERCTHCTLWEKWRTGGADGSVSQQHVGWSCILGGAVWWSATYPDVSLSNILPDGAE